MTDDELRAMVREAVARHMGGGPAAGSRAGRILPGIGQAVSPAQAQVVAAASPPAPAPPALAGVAPAGGSTIVVANAPGGVAIAVGPGATVQLHISHAAFALPPACEGGHDGPCTIEPDAACNQCGFCQSYGH